MYFKEDDKENLACMLIMLTCLTYKYHKSYYEEEMHGQ